MFRRRAFLALFVAAGLALSARSTSAATVAPTAKMPVIFERATPAPDGSMTSLILYMRDRLTIAYRALRGTRISDPTGDSGYQLESVTDGPEGADPLGAKDHGLHGANPAQTRIR
jgi:hypothetical protein